MSGLASLISGQLGSLVNLPRPLLLAIFILVIALLTEFMSNTAICNLMSPIAAAVVSLVLYMSLSNLDPGLDLSKGEPTVLFVYSSIYVFLL